MEFYYEDIDYMYNKEYYECVYKAIDIYAEEQSLNHSEVCLLRDFVNDCNLEDDLLYTFEDDLKKAFEEEAYEEYKEMKEVE